MISGKYAKVYQKVTESGQLKSGLANEVFRLVCIWPNKTAGELATLYSVENRDSIRNRTDIARRLSDLKNLGLITASKAKITCSATGRQASVWSPSGKAVTNKVPDTGSAQHTGMVFETDHGQMKPVVFLDGKKVENGKLTVEVPIEPIDVMGKYTSTADFGPYPYEEEAKYESLVELLNDLIAKRKWYWSYSKKYKQKNEAQILALSFILNGN